MALVHICYLCVVSGPLQDGYTSVHYASANNHTDILHLLLSHSGSVTTCTPYNETPLHLACLNGSLEAAQLLTQHRADLQLQARDGKGNTVLHLSAASDSCSLIHWITHDMKHTRLLNSQNKVSYNTLKTGHPC